MPRWTYAPLVTWVVCSLWPSVLLLFDILRGVPLPYGGIATLLKAVLEFVLVLAIANWAFVRPFFVVRRKAKERQRLSIGLQAAMWFSLVAMLIPTGLLMLLLYYLTYYLPHGRGSDIGNGIVLMFALLIQVLIQPILGLIGWFAGDRLSATRSPISCIMVSLFALAISAAAAENVKSQDAENRIELPGFSILPPAGRDWRPYSVPQQGILVMFSKIKNADQGADKLQSFVLLGTSRFIELPYEDDQQLRDKLRENLRTKVQPKLLKSLEVSPDADEPSATQSSPPITTIVTPRAQCIRYRMQQLNESGGLGQFLTLETRGKLCLHPFHPAYVIDLSYSQRSLAGGWDNAFDTEADHMLQSLAFEPMPISDYVAARLHEYASLLDKLDKPTEASKIRQFAERLGHPQSEGSTYLGFDPRTVLNEYAKLLRAQDNDVEARRMEVLGLRWQRNNLAGFIKQQATRPPR
jgi:hypothetical protein